MMDETIRAQANIDIDVIQRSEVPVLHKYKAQIAPNQRRFDPYTAIVLDA